MFFFLWAFVFSFFLVLLIYKNREIAACLLAGWILKTILIGIHFYINPLPGSSNDAATFGASMQYFASLSLESFLDEFPGVSSYAFSWLASILVRFSAGDLIIVSFAGALANSYIVVLVWRFLGDSLGQRFESCRKFSKGAMWFLSLYPLSALYSVLPMREVWFSLLILVGFIRLYNWSIYYREKDFLISAFALFVAVFFHSGALLFLIPMLIYRIFNVFVRLISLRVNFFGFFYAICLTIFVFNFMSGDIVLPKFRSIDHLSSDVIVGMVSRKFYIEDAGAIYPSFLQPSSIFELLLSTPIRVVYFLFSPFVWDLSLPIHIIGFIDGLVFLGLVIIILRGGLDRKSALVIFCFLVMVIAFSLGVSNFGTGMRHRLKILPIIILLVVWSVMRLKSRRVLSK